MLITAIPAAVIQAIDQALEKTRANFQERWSKPLILILSYHDDNVWFAKEHFETAIKGTGDWQTQITLLAPRGPKELPKISLISRGDVKISLERLVDTVEIYDESGNLRAYEDLVKELMEKLESHWT